MKWISLTTIVVAFFTCDTPSEQAKALNSVSQPVLIKGEGWEFKGTENLIFVPENRRDPASRHLALHYFHFPAREKSDLPPVAFLGAGPGEPYSVRVFYDGDRAKAWRFELDFVNQKRDVLLINQRGNSDAPGLQIPNFRYRWKNGSFEEPLDLEIRGEYRRKAYQEAITRYQSQGVDLRGYDIISFIDDIDAVRKHISAEKLALVGNSFASQWALGYIQRYPDRVDRALLSGIEPLDHNYDDPQGIWNVFERIEAYAEGDNSIANKLPEVGLTEAFKEIVRRLESAPVTVHLDIPQEEIDEQVIVGVDDFRFSRMDPFANSYRGEIGSWPKYITELYNGDYRTLALRSRGRGGRSHALMIDALFNNSLGISPERERELNNREARKWLGDLASHYTATRDICPATKVDPMFRKHVSHNIPMILIQGDMDLSTPYENATFLMQYLENGHLLTVKNGSHNAKRAMIFGDSLLTERVYEFMNIDFAKTDFLTFKKQLPDTFELPAFEFWDIEGKSLFDIYTEEE